MSNLFSVTAEIAPGLGQNEFLKPKVIRHGPGFLDLMLVMLECDELPSGSPTVPHERFGVFQDGLELRIPPVERMRLSDSVQREQHIRARLLKVSSQMRPPIGIADTAVRGNFQVDFRARHMNGVKDRLKMRVHDRVSPMAAEQDALQLKEKLARDNSGKIFKRDIANHEPRIKNPEFSILKPSAAGTDRVAPRRQFDLCGADIFGVENHGIFMAGVTGLEPATSAVTVLHSDQLSYTPALISVYRTIRAFANYFD